MRLNTNSQPWRFWLISLVIIGIYVLSPVAAWSSNSTLESTMVTLEAYRFAQREWRLPSLSPGQHTIASNRHNLPAIVPALAITATSQSTMTARLDALLSKLAATNRLSGAVLVTQAGKVVLSQGYGMANLEYDLPNTPQTKFRIGEMTQLFTALTILQLVEQGKVKLDASICEYIQPCPAAWQPVTIHHLLTQTSGIRDVTNAPLPRDFARKSKSPKQLIDSVRDNALLSAPGKQWNYSMVNYLLLGEIVHSASGQPFALYLKEHILKPLHMDNTGVDDRSKILKQRASGYNNQGTNAEYVDMNGLDAALGIYSTVEDLFRLDQALVDNTLVSEELLERMTGPLAHVTQFDTEFGYGWWVMDIFGRRRLDLPAMSIPGFNSTYVRFPQDQVTIIILTNRELWAGVVGDEITKVLFDLP